jgi:2-desacetyl-2-hydroxyethyl bacteriochlorophyllide A dehydrogenase
MNSCGVYFDAPGRVSVREEDVPHPGPGEVLVNSLVSAISPGTEMLLFRGQFPKDIPVDESIPSLQGKLAYPLKYGYAAVGQVAILGEGVPEAWMGKRVFVFNPHQSCFTVSVRSVMPVPEGVSLEDAVFLPSMETALNFVMDGSPLIGERVVVLGQGIVGLLTTALLARFPLHALVTLDSFPLRRKYSFRAGATASLDPQEEGVSDLVLKYLGSKGILAGADLVFELSGSPYTLDLAIEIAGFSARIVVGSWYGEKRAAINLGGRFHRNRLHMVSSQVSSLAPDLTGRWTKQRRFEVAWEMIRLINPSRWITHRFPIQAAPQAYDLIDKDPGQTIQVLFSYAAETL